MGFIKRYKIFFAIAALSVFVYAGYKVYVAYKPIVYPTAPVLRGSVVENISETGKVVSEGEVNLFFRDSGRVAEVLVKEGEAVAEGQSLSSLETNELKIREREAAASLATARADYGRALAGAPVEEIRIYQTAVQNAQNNLDKTRASVQEKNAAAEKDIQSAQTAYENAKRALDNAKATAVNGLANLYETAKTTMRSNLVSASIALSDVDSILGVDNETINDSFERFVGAQLDNDAQKKEGEEFYKLAGAAYASVSVIINAFSSATTQSSVDAVIPQAKDLLSRTLLAADRVKFLLDNSTTGTGFTLTDLNTKKAMMDTDRTAMAAASTSLDQAAQAISAMRVANQASVDLADSALKTADRNLASAIIKMAAVSAESQSAVSAAEGALSSAQVELALKQATLRAVDRAVYEAKVQAAQASLDFIRQQLSDAVLKAPAAGVVSSIDLERGELATPTARAAAIISSRLEIEVDVSELDIRKIFVGQVLEATFDALGPAVYLGKVTEVAPREKLKDEDIFYKVTAVLDQADIPLKSGMTADISIRVGERTDVVIVPERLVIKRASQPYIEVLKNGKPLEVPITIGLEGSQYVEVLDGVVEGDLLVTPK